MRCELFISKAHTKDLLRRIASPQSAHASHSQLSHASFRPCTWYTRTEMNPPFPNSYGRAGWGDVLPSASRGERVLQVHEPEDSAPVSRALSKSRVSAAVALAAFGALLRPRTGWVIFLVRNGAKLCGVDNVLCCSAPGLLRVRCRALRHCGHDPPQHRTGETDRSCFWRADEAQG